jgi:hypothetical protein
VLIDAVCHSSSCFHAGLDLLPWSSEWPTLGGRAGSGSVWCTTGLLYEYCCRGGQHYINAGSACLDMTRPLFLLSCLLTLSANVLSVEQVASSRRMHLCYHMDMCWAPCALTGCFVHRQALSADMQHICCQFVSAAGFVVPSQPHSVSVMVLFTCSKYSKMVCTD